MGNIVAEPEVDAILKVARSALAEGEFVSCVFVSNERHHAPSGAAFDRGIFVLVDCHRQEIFAVRRRLMIQMEGSNTVFEVTVFNRYEISEVREAVASASRLYANPGGDRYVGRLATDSDIQFARSLATGVPLLNETEFHVIARLIDYHMISIAYFEMTSELCLKRAKDAVCFHESGRLELAAFCVRDAVDDCYEMLIAFAGEGATDFNRRLCVGEKLFGGGNMLHLGYLALMQMFSVEESGFELYFGAALRYIQSGFDLTAFPVGDLRKSNIEARVCGIADDGGRHSVRKIPHAWLRREGSRFWLNLPRRRIELGESDARVWFEVDNFREREEIISSLRQLDKSEDILDKFIKAQLVFLPLESEELAVLSS